MNPDEPHGIGLMNTHVPEEYGGPGRSSLDSCLTSRIQRLVIARETLLPRRVSEPVAVAA